MGENGIGGSLTSLGLTSSPSTVVGAVTLFVVDAVESVRRSRWKTHIIYKPPESLRRLAVVLRMTNPSIANSMTLVVSVMHILPYRIERMGLNGTSRVVRCSHSEGVSS